ncbi:MAG: universal stress protein [Bacteroidetes bacterium]|nr:universal stress protein [Bacteroidota bacterium]
MKILIPTDFSQQVDYAWLITQKLGEQLEMEVHFLHVELSSGITLDEAGNLVSGEDVDLSFYNKLKEMAEDKLQSICAPRSNKISTHIAFGPVKDKIIEFANAGGFDLIVMGTKGAHGLKELFSGTETQQVVRHSKVPVLSLMCNRSELNIKNILLIHEMGKNEPQNLQLMKNIQKAFNAKIHLLKIIESDSKKDAELSKIAEFALLNKIENFEAHILKDSDVEAGIIHFNQMHEMDIVCIGTHGRTGFSKFIKGSVAEKLVNHLFKPIITFHLND